jgi:undecaprenyl-diphosphatase
MRDTSHVLKYITRAYGKMSGMIEALHSIDLWLFSLIYAFAGRSHAADMLIIFFAHYYSYVLTVIMLFILARMYRENIQTFWKYMFAVGSAVIARVVVGGAFDIFLPRTRPFDALHIPHLLTVNSSSFPSGHTIFLFALATGIWLADRKLGYFLFASGLVVGLTRVMSAVHYPSDILGGIILGIGTTLALKKLSDRFLVHKLA